MTAPAHLSSQQVEGYRRRTLSPLELLDVDDHIQVCEPCRHRLAEGEPLASAWAAWEGLVDAREDAGVPAGWRHPRVWIAIAAAAVLALLLGGLALMRASRPEPAGPNGRRTAVAPVPSQGPPAAKAGPSSQGSERGATASSSPDRDRMADLPLAWREQVRAAVASRRLALPPDYGELAGGGAGTLRGEVPEASLATLSPVAVMVRSDRPTFVWRPLPGAQEHRVSVFDAGYALVAESGPVEGDRWTPSRPLPRDKVLSWQVTAQREGEQVTAPRPPAPEARFKILEERQLGELEQAERTVPRSPLVLAVLYARAGLVEEAERELRALRSGDPDLAGDLLRSLQKASPRPKKIAAW